MALSAARSTPKRSGDLISVSVNGGAILYAGGLISLLSDGTAVPAGTASSGRAIGVAPETYDNSAGADGAVVGNAETGTFRFKNSTSSDLIAKADIGEDCYIVSDEQVAKTDNSAARAKAGVIVDVDAQGVWVRVGP